MTTTGMIQDITRLALGSELTAAFHHANPEQDTDGNTVLHLDDVADFAEAGGLVRIGGVDANAQVVRYASISEPDSDDDADDPDQTGVDPEEMGAGLEDLAHDGFYGGFGGAQEWWAEPVEPYTDPEETDIDVIPSTMTLTEPLPDDPDYVADALTHDWPAGTRVDMWDPLANSASMEWRAICQPAATQDSHDAIEAILSFPFIPLLQPGTRDPDHGEIALLDEDATGDWRVVDIVGRHPVVQADFLPPLFLSGRVIVHTSGGHGSHHVPFDPPLDSAPLVVCSGHNAANLIYATEPATDGFTANARRVDGSTAAGSVTVDWIAIPRPEAD